MHPKLRRASESWGLYQVSVTETHGDGFPWFSARRGRCRASQVVRNDVRRPRQVAVPVASARRWRASESLDDTLYRPRLPSYPAKRGNDLHGFLSPKFGIRARLFFHWAGLDLGCHSFARAGYGKSQTLMGVENTTRGRSGRPEVSLRRWTVILWGIGRCTRPRVPSGGYLANSGDRIASRWQFEGGISVLIR